MKPLSPVVVLHRAQLGENIGMSARAMGNCGLQDLRLSAPREGWDQTKARAAAASAENIVQNRIEFSDLSSALADCQYVFATSARRRNMPIRVLDAEAAASEARAAQGRVAFLFGAEANGLDNEAISLADAVIEIPLHSECSSLNLSQAVLLVAYSWWRTGDEIATVAHEQTPANRAQTSYFLKRLQSELDRNGFFTDPNLGPVMWRNIQSMFHRSQFSEQEVQTWHGIISALIKR